MVNVHNTTTSWSEYIDTAIDLRTRMGLRDRALFHSIVDSYPLSPDHEGNVVQVTVDGEAPTFTTPISETVDVDAVVSGDPRQFNVTMAEYGGVLGSTYKLRANDWSQKTVERLGNQLAYSMTQSLDILVQAVLDAATNVLFGTAAGTIGDLTGPVVAAGITNAKHVLGASALLHGRRAEHRNGELWAGLIHPHASFDLRAETGDHGWLQPHIRVDTANVYSTKLGVFASTDWVESPRCTAVAGTPDVYTTYVYGREALMEAAKTPFHTLVSPMTDNLNRFQRVGWHGHAGWSVFRQNAIQLIKTASSMEALAIPAWDPKA